MNQTKKRLSIINLAISINDTETIQLQVLKLGMIQTDEKIQNIISMLQAKNYAQTQGLITTYIETSTQDVLQRISQGKKHIPTEEEQSTIDEFKLFVNAEEDQEKIEIDINDFMHKEEKKKPMENIEEINLNDFLSVSPVSQTQVTEENDFDSLLKIDVNDLLKYNIDIGRTEEDSFFSLSPQENKVDIHTSHIPTDNFFDARDEEMIDDNTEIPNNLDITSNPDIIVEKMKIKTEEVTTEVNILFSEDNSLKKENLRTEIPPAIAVPEKEAPTHYKAIPYISQKLESMKKQYHSSHTAYEPFSTLTELLSKISQEGYSENEIVKTLMDAKEEVVGPSNAVQLLLTCAATESPFAQLILARELYKGVLLTQNIPQAFIILNTLAMDDYPEALCDLAQFYENGIGTKKDKKRAEHLYKDAMELGIKRAKAHFERLQQSNKGFFR